MKRIRLGAGILNQTPLDWDGNTQRILEAIRMARQQQVHVLCLPELCITGYGCEDMFLAPHVWQTAWVMLEKIAPETEGMIVSVGLPLFVTNGVYNTACVLAHGRIAGFVAKQHLAGDDPFQGFFIGLFYQHFVLMLGKGGKTKGQGKKY